MRSACRQYFSFPFTWIRLWRLYVYVSFVSETFGTSIWHRTTPAPSLLRRDRLLERRGAQEKHVPANAQIFCSKTEYLTCCILQILKSWKFRKSWKFWYRQKSFCPINRQHWLVNVMNKDNCLRHQTELSIGFTLLQATCLIHSQLNF